MFSEQQLRSLSPRDRRQLMRLLAGLAQAEQAGPAGGRRRRALALAFIVFCCLVLVVWIGVLAVTLPRSYRAGDWRGAWVGFDAALLAAFAATGWAAWRRRQILVACLVVLATLLCCDAWFDVLLDAQTGGFWLSLISALVIELPLAALAVMAARRLLRLTLYRVSLLAGEPDHVPSLRKTPLFGAEEPGAGLLDLFPVPCCEQAGPGAPGGGRDGAARDGAVRA